MALDDFSVSVEIGNGALAMSGGGAVDGMVGRWAAAVVVIGGDRAGESMAALRAELGDSPTSGEVVQVLREDARFDTGEIDLVALISTPDGLRLFVRGRGEARTEADEVIGGDPSTERDLPGAKAVWLGFGGPPTRQSHPVLDLQRGVVPGRGAVVYRATVAPRVVAPLPSHRSAEVDPTNPAAPPAAPEVRPFASLDWGSQVETREPLPLADALSDEADVRVSAEQVMGIRCSRSHFNNPRAGYCQVCGISMVHLTHRLEPGPRPTLGFVVFADGATYAIDRSYLIGRSPRPAASSGLTPITTQDSTHSVSREHGELRLDGWDVQYIDQGSTNGSFVWEAPRGAWRQLAPNEPVVLESGMTVSVGRMSFVFQGASKPVEAR